MISTYYQKLIDTVLNYSYYKDWNKAVFEWEVIDCEEDENAESSCICGKENIRYLFKIRNKINKNILYPIGSTCIKKFQRDELDDIVSIKIDLFKLLHALEKNDYIDLSTDYFSRKLLNYLYENDAFIPSQYNYYSPRNDYIFMLDMFNKRDKSTLTEKQKNKINAIIINQINPYLRKILEQKIISNIK